MIPLWFIYLNGFAMSILGGALLFTRPRRPGASTLLRFVNLGTLWALLCLGVGVALLSLALGYWSLPSPSPPAPRPRSPFSTR